MLPVKVWPKVITLIGVNCILITWKLPTLDPLFCFGTNYTKKQPIEHFIKMSILSISFQKCVGSLYGKNPPDFQPKKHKEPLYCKTIKQK